MPACMLCLPMNSRDGESHLLLYLPVTSVQELRHTADYRNHHLSSKELCPEAKVEATTERYEDEDGHVRIYPPTGLNQGQIAELEGKIAERCVDILVKAGVFLCAAVYEPDK